MKAKCQMETDTQLNLNISRVKKKKTDIADKALE